MCWRDSLLSFQIVKDWFDKTVTTDFVEWNERSFSQCVTYDHKMAYLTSSTRDNWLYTWASKLPKSANLPKSGLFTKGTSSITPEEARLWCAVHADGAKNQRKWTFGFKKIRKVERLHKLLKNLNIEYDYVLYKSGVHGFRFDKVGIEPWLDSYILNWPIEALDAYIDEAPYWDGVRVDVEGKTTHARYFLTTKKDQAQWFMTMVHLTNRASLLTTVKPTGYGKLDLHRVSINERPLFRNVTPLNFRETKRILCPVTPTGFLS